MKTSHFQRPVISAPRVPITGVWQLLQERAKSGSGPAMLWHPFEGTASQFSYAEIAHAAASIAAGMSGRGIRRGDRVLIHLENCPEFIFSWFACAAIGAVAVCTNARSAPSELEYFVGHSGARAVITQPKFFDVISRIARDVSWIAVTDNDAGFAAQNSVPTSLAFHLLKGNPDLLPSFAPSTLDPLCVQYTSGTTSRPKGVLWTHGNGVWAARTNAVHQALTPNDRFFCYLPLFHANALAYNMLASLWVGCSYVLTPKWSTSRFWDIATQYGCTWMSTVSMTMRAIQQLEAPSQHSFRLFGTGVCDIEWDRTLGLKSLGWWGMTETVSQGIIGDPFSPNRPWSMGRPAPEYEIAVVDDDGAATEAEEIGNLLIRGIPGQTIFAEYLYDSEATRNSFTDDGWFKTGDLVVRHADGHISFADRSKDMLRVGSENVAASEIERVIQAVRGVSEVAVVRKPDPKLDEVPVAFVTATGDTTVLVETILSACRAHLADFKVPRDVHVVPALPRGTLEKVNKARLRHAAESGDMNFDSGLDWDEPKP